MPWWIMYYINLTFEEGTENNHKSNYFAHVISIISASSGGQNVIRSDQGERLRGEDWQD